MINRIGNLKIVATALMLSTFLAGCQTRRTGLFGTDNYGRNGWANNVLNNPINQNSLADGRAIGYIVYNQSSNGGFANGQTAVPYNGNAGGTRTNNSSQGTNTNAGGIAGANGVVGLQTPCMLKVISGSSLTLDSGSNQSFAGSYNETYAPSSGQPFYSTGLRQPITCGRDSQIAATAGSFYVTSGSTGNQIYVYPFNAQGIPTGQARMPIAVTSPTKIAASSSGHIAIISNNGKTLELFKEMRKDSNGSWIADRVHVIPAQGTAVFTDVVFDREPAGAMYVTERLTQAGGGRLQIFPMDAAYNGLYDRNGIQSPFVNSQRDFFNPQLAYNFTNNLPSESALSYLFRQNSPLILKANQGLAGVMTTAGHPFLVVSELGIPQAEANQRTAAEMNDIMSNPDKMLDHVTAVSVFDPFMVTNRGSSFARATYKDFAIGNDIMYLISNQGLSTIRASLNFQIDTTSPWTTPLSVGTPNFIEMSEDQKMAVVGGSAGLQIGRVAGNNLIFSSTGRPDVSENGEVIHATVLEKVYRKARVDNPVATNNPANTNNTTNTTTTPTSENNVTE